MITLAILMQYDNTPVVTILLNQAAELWCFLAMHFLFSLFLLNMMLSAVPELVTLMQVMQIESDAAKRRFLMAVLLESRPRCQFSMKVSDQTKRHPASTALSALLVAGGLSKRTLMTAAQLLPLTSYTGTHTKFLGAIQERKDEVLAAVTDPRKVCPLLSRMG